jgi:hypothetical protein
MEGNKFSSEKCAEYRATFDLDPEERELNQYAALDRHADSCTSCKQWTNQINSISQYVKDMPQFDVPEATTQKLLASIRGERKRINLTETVVLVFALLTLSLIFYAFPIDSMEGTCSWLMSATIVAAFGLLAPRVLKTGAEVR